MWPFTVVPAAFKQAVADQVLGPVIVLGVLFQKQAKDRDTEQGGSLSCTPITDCKQAFLRAPISTIILLMS